MPCSSGRISSVLQEYLERRSEVPGAHAVDIWCPDAGCRTGMLCCLWVQGCTEAAAGDDGFVACAHRAGIVRAGCTDKSHTDSVCVRGAPIELCSPPCVPCRASRPAHFLRRCVGRASKLECCTSVVVVFYHLPTPRLAGCDDAARRRCQRDRPFRHSYTIVPTPCKIAIVRLE